MTGLNARRLLKHAAREDWRTDCIIAWLQAGLKSLRDNPNANPFLPLCFSSNDEVVSQVQAVLQEAVVENPDFHLRLKEGLRFFLRQFDLHNQKAVLDATSLWSFYGEVGDKEFHIPTDVYEAIERLVETKQNAGDDKIKNLVTAVCSVVARADMDGVVAVDFFKELHDEENVSMGNGRFWDSSFFELVLGKSLTGEDTNTRLAAWEDIKIEYPQEAKLYDVTRPHDVAMMNSFFRQILGVPRTV